MRESSVTPPETLLQAWLRTYWHGPTKITVLTIPVMATVMICVSSLYGWLPIGIVLATLQVVGLLVASLLSVRRKVPTGG